MLHTQLTHICLFFFFSTGTDAIRPLGCKPRPHCMRCADWVDATASRLSLVRPCVSQSCTLEEGSHVDINQCFDRLINQNSEPSLPFTVSLGGGEKMFPKMMKYLDNHDSDVSASSIRNHYSYALIILTITTYLECILLCVITILLQLMYNEAK